ncbi:MAG: DUF1330 domain-containing protein [Chloroflexi bacterium AL-W]|nr:DUF1330 domain-containing protein [Chloroflexi bacterium AL-N1]NOK65879.1 DUF1330 domain-containing protein [Chloroflexi bacterium AL-N10]NOK74180.1 DUF1330 domain-containing protein [Chloroflexi bacterium AL-N5]NOK80912.1 DUF1330 domain-containing protein [Chloroflexi bacterium AL-W]NOK88438.1 DUF1330 domain-containing protein [Chloroflexi bacterium AL-N15]
MALEMLVGLQIVDDAAYQAYREAMLPLLQRYGGGFGYDFKIAEVLISSTTDPINRVFTIYFADKAAMEAFFTNKEYLTIRQRYFESSVAHTTIIATYERG